MLCAQVREERTETETETAIRQSEQREVAQALLSESEQLSRLIHRHKVIEHRPPTRLGIALRVGASLCTRNLPSVPHKLAACSEGLLRTGTMLLYTA